MNVIGLDLGTTTLSAVVVDSDTGVVLETLNISNATDLHPRYSFERIQDANAIAEKALGMVAVLKEKYAIDAIGIDGQMHGIVYLDDTGVAVSPLFTWQDQRGEESLGDITYAKALSGRTGKNVATGYGMTTHYWNTLNRRIPEGAATLCTIYDYVGMRLTGRQKPLQHVSSAASLGLLDTEAGSWDMTAVANAGMDARYLPEVTDKYAVIGMSDGIPVSCGIGDNQASFIGSVRSMGDTVLVNMGTGGQVSMLAHGSSMDQGLEIRPLGDSRFILVGSALCGGRSYALLERFLRSCVELAGYDSTPLYESMNRAGLALLEGEDLLRVDTRFNGTRTDPDLRGSITGIGTENFDATHLIAGTLAGMADEIHGLYTNMTALGNPAAGKLVGSGNAIRRNPALKRAFEKVFGIEMFIPSHGEEAAYGAALTSMAASGIKATVVEAQRLIQYKPSSL